MENNYLQNHNNSINEASEALILDANSVLPGCTLENPTYGTGTISIVKDLNLEGENPDLIVEIDFSGVKRQFYLHTALNKATTDDSTKELINNFYNEVLILSAESKRLIKIREQEELDKQQKLKEERLKEEKIKKAEIKREALKKQQLDIVSKLKKHKVLVNDNYYVGLGYIAKHVRRIAADMPDYLEDWFIKTFGNQEHKAYDQTVLCPSGLPSHYALGFRIDLDTNENIPSSLVSHLSTQEKTNKPIADTQFIYEIMVNYGFKFGKTQDLDAILDSIPSDQLDNFRLGLNA